MKTHIIDAKALEHGWIDGKIDNYRFQAKVFDVGSKFGIDGGRISKLEVWDEQKRKSRLGFGEMLSYDRGWNKRPDSENAESILQALLGYGRALPTLEYWEVLAAEEPFHAEMYLRNRPAMHIRISVSTEGWGTALDLPDGLIMAKLNPITVWELKLCEAKGRVPRITHAD